MGRPGRLSRRLVCETNFSEAGTPTKPGQEITVNILKQLYLTLLQLAKQVWLLPQTVANAVEQRKLQALRNEREAERLDRIRNPSKYLGK